MTTSIIILLIAAVFQFFVGTLAYVRETLQGTSQPNRMTFLIWAIGPFIGVAAGIAAGGSWALLPVFMSGFGPLCVFLASFVNPKAYWKLGWIDYVCGALAVLALVLWAFTQNPLVAIVLAIAADVLATYPTLIKAWKYPETETGRTYVVAGLCAFVGIIVSQFVFSEIAFLLYLLIANMALAFAIYRKRFSALIS